MVNPSTSFTVLPTSLSEYDMIKSVTDLFLSYILISGAALKKAQIVPDKISNRGPASVQQIEKGGHMVCDNQLNYKICKTPSVFSVDTVCSNEPDAHCVRYFERAAQGMNYR